VCAGAARLSLGTESRGRDGEYRPDDCLIKRRSRGSRRPGGGMFEPGKMRDAVEHGAVKAVGESNPVGTQDMMRRRGVQAGGEGGKSRELLEPRQ